MSAHIESSHPLTLTEAVMALGSEEIDALAASMIADSGPRDALATALLAVRDGEVKYRGLADLIPQQVWTADPSGGLNYVNDRVCAYFGQTFETFLGNGWLTVLHPDDVEPTLETWTHSLQTGDPYEIEFRLRRSDGVYRPHVGRAFPLLCDGEIVRWFGTNTDMADARERRRLAAIVESSEDAIIGEALDGTILSWNAGAERLFGYRAEEVLGLSVEMLEPPESRGEVVSRLERIGRGERVPPLDTRRLAKSGVPIEVSLTVSPIRNEEGAIVGASAVSRDIGDRKRMERELATQALQDRLTGLPNRTLLMDRLAHTLETRRSNATTVAVLFVDLDNFKLINDSLGHSVGDDVLAAVAPRLRSLMRAGDTVARFGGDEFVILLDGAAPTDAVELATRVVEAFREPIEVGEATHFLTASVGVAFAAPDSDAETLISNADAAMYNAKETGRSRYATFDHTFRDRILRRVDLEASLRTAIDSGEVHLEYQPIVSLSDRRTVGAEGLLRWRPEDRAPVPPAHFIPIAEQSGLIVPLGERVLYDACAAAVRWHADHPGLPVAVNVSARQLADLGFVNVVENALTESGLDPGSLCLEITEGILMEYSSAVVALGKLRSAGVRIALDDFGTGYSSLGYLKRFPIDVLKIDRSFVAEISEESSRSAIVDAILKIAGSFRLDVVAEGVEDEAQARYLSEAGCPCAQGFLFSPAVPAAEFAAALH